MSFRGLLKQTCTIQTKTESGTDDSGHPTITGWANTYTGVPCFVYSYAQGREIVQEKEVLLSDFVLCLFPDQAITEEDRVIFDGATYHVISVGRPARGTTGAFHHKRAFIRLVT